MEKDEDGIPTDTEIQTKNKEITQIARKIEPEKFKTIFDTAFQTIEATEADEDLKLNLNRISILIGEIQMQIAVKTEAGETKEKWAE